MKLKLDKKNVMPFLDRLMGRYDLYAPVRIAEGVSVYRKIDQPGEVAFGHPNPQKPVKELFFPQSEVMLRYERTGDESRINSTEEVERDRIILGARSCDVQAISILDHLFLGKEYTDPYFLRKRERTTMIGFACNDPLTTCFCSSVNGGPFARAGSDLFFIDLGEAYLVECLTEKGKALQDSALFEKAGKKDLALSRELEEKALKKLKFSLPVEEMGKKMDQIAEAELWDRMHEKCIGCGICTFLCPTCHCFDIVDEALDRKGQRVRNWDSCLFPLYSLETSGHNPRPTCRERTRQRIMHKFNYYPKNFGQIACVGCGRCIVYCPVNFDIRQAIEQIASSCTSPGGETEGARREH